MKKLLYIVWIAVIILAVLVSATVSDPSPKIEMFTLVVILGGAIFGFPIYFLPSFVAAHRCAKLRWGILIGNLFLGATGFIWVLALIVAVTDETDRDEPPLIRVQLEKNDTG